MKNEWPWVAAFIVAVILNAFGFLWVVFLAAVLFVVLLFAITFRTSIPKRVKYEEVSPPVDLPRIMPGP